MTVRGKTMVAPGYQLGWTPSIIEPRQPVDSSPHRSLHHLARCTGNSGHYRTRRDLRAGRPHVLLSGVAGGDTFRPGHQFESGLMAA